MDKWYVLKDNTTGPNGRTYRVHNGELEMHSVAARGWVTSAFQDLDALKAYAIRWADAHLYVKDAGRG